MRAEQHRIKTLFVRCGQLREELLGLGHDAQGVQEIAMNAAVVAAQTGGRTRVFAEIASQVERTSRRLGSASSRASEAVGRVTLATLNAFRRDALRAKYHVVLPQLAGTNEELVRDALARLDERVAADLASVRRDLAVARAALRTLERLCLRLFAALGAIRIEEVQLAEAEQPTIASLGESLGIAQEKIQPRLERIAALLGECRALVSSTNPARGAAKEERGEDPQVA